MDRTKELEEQVLKLSLKVDEMRNRMVRLEGPPAEHQNGSAPRSRRGFLRMGLAAAAGAVGLTALKAVPTSANTGTNMIIGQANVSQNPTTLQPNATAVPVLAVEDQNFVAADLTAALTSVTPNESFNAPLQGLGGPSGVIEGVDGWAKGSQAYGVYGFTDTGTGVTGESLTGIGLYSRGTGRIRQDPMAAGAPNFPPNLFEQIRDVNGVLWISGAIGAPPAVWRRVNSLRTDTADGLGNPFKPFRLVDTRNNGGPAGNGDVRYYTAAPAGAGDSAIPADAIAVVGNLTAVGFSPAGGYLAITPKGVAYNSSADPSSLNFSTGAYAWANSFICGLGIGANVGQLAVHVGCYAGTTNFIIDITGYIQ